MTVVYELLRDFSIPVITHRYVEKDVMLYALGLGLGADPLDLVSILQSMKAAGALRAELEVL